MVKEVEVLSADKDKWCAKLTDDYDVGDKDMLHFGPMTDKRTGDRDSICAVGDARETAARVLHHKHTSCEGGHQGSITDMQSHLYGPNGVANIDINNALSVLATTQKMFRLSRE